MRLTKKLIKRAKEAGIVVHAHDWGYIVHEEFDDDGTKVEVVDCEDFLDTVVCALKEYRFRGNFFVVYVDEQTAATELQDHLELIGGS